uniref:hypothetical protein n=1 Tax=Paractinoplanes polyasparticus TaxID=2856853 RepID=UPI001C8560A9|nr:hypothetical protein [Actinoplanes polyasparticus]
MAGFGRTRTVLRWPAVLATLACVSAAAGSAPAGAGPGGDTARYSQCRKAMQQIADEYRDADNVSVAFICTRPDGTSVDPKLWMPAPRTRPAPIPAMTGTHTGCTTGSGRPVVGTTLTTARATAAPGEEIIYEYQPLDGSETVGSSGSGVLEFGPGDLAPGGSYRWRARVDDTADQALDNAISRSPDDDELGWSPWCEFTVAADAVDYRPLGDVSLEALNELRLRPDRRYAVTLSGRQQRLLRTATDVGRTSARMTLTGPRWTDLLVQLTESAFIANEVAAEADKENSAPPDGTAHRNLVDAISIELGGPQHPEL